MEDRRPSQPPPMKLEILIDNHPLDLDPSSADAVEVEPGIYSILLDGHSYEVKLEPSEDGVYATVDCHRYPVQGRGPRTPPRPPAARKSPPPCPARESVCWSARATRWKPARASW